MRGRSSLVNTGCSPPPGRLTSWPGARTQPAQVQGRLFFCSERTFLLERGCLFQVRPMRPRYSPASSTRRGGSTKGPSGPPSLPGSDSSRGGAEHPRSPPVDSDYPVRRGALEARVRHV
ncbi:hypothetical protein NDU88_005309 [Pleurodeles waltl]|uniref:Uncharacterized protein n=1 Tax=Pleurodeles waltl TaxID=8319 RepID=A0AAV7VIN2_PLEWA|nr:hypothetical protein NDU88_005309 [Pleurodeles waltl]